MRAPGAVATSSGCRTLCHGGGRRRVAARQEDAPMATTFRRGGAGAAVAILMAGAMASAQCPSERVFSSRPWEGASFGNADQIEGGVAIVADRSDQTYCPVCSSGAVHAFRRREGQWRFEQTIFHSRIGGT